MKTVDDKVVFIGNNASRTSRDAGSKFLPKSGTMRRVIYETVQNHGGLADFELEALLNGKHQTVSASRRSLVIDGFLFDSGYTRTNESGNECTVWKVAAVQGVFF